MIPEELEKAILPDRPSLVVFAIGTTFKGGIDEIDELNAVFDKYPAMAGTCVEHSLFHIWRNHLEKPFTAVRRIF